MPPAAFTRSKTAWAAEWDSGKEAGPVSVEMAPILMGSVLVGDAGSGGGASGGASGAGGSSAGAGAGAVVSAAASGVTAGAAAPPDVSASPASGAASLGWFRARCRCRSRDRRRVSVRRRAIAAAPACDESQDPQQ